MASLIRRGTWFSLMVALVVGLANLPTTTGPLETLVSNGRLMLHLMGFLPRQRTVKYGQINPPAPRPSNGTIPEVQGFVGVKEFHEQYLGQGPVVFRQGASKEFGFDPDCLTKGGQRTAVEGLEEEMGETRVPIFTNQYDDASAELITIKEYRHLAAAAEANASTPNPYPRAFPQKSLKTCQPFPSERLKEYKSFFGWVFQEYLPKISSMPDISLMFVSYIQETDTKMHMDLGDSFFQQVHGRKKWIFADPEYASQLQIWGDTLNLVYISGFDVHREPVPPQIPLREVILHPGDLLYFPSMTFHAVKNLDPVTVGVDNPAGDVGVAFRRHWLLTLMTILNPWIPIQSLQIWIRTGTWNPIQLYFDGFTKNKETECGQKQTIHEAVNHEVSLEA